MSRNKKLLLLLSFVISVLLWSYLVSWKFGIILIVSLLIHEYGHYWWMGKDGVKNRTMFFLPPFGAMAMAKDVWPSYGAESRIALAGPLFGFISAVLSGVLWSVTELDIFGASIILICWVNLLNAALPIPILDGGHVIKAVLFSIHYRLGIFFYIFGILLAAFLFMIGSFVFLFILFLLYQDFRVILRSKADLEAIEKALTRAAKFDADSLIKEIKEDLEKERDLLSKICNMSKMTPKEMFNNLACLLLINSIYVFVFVKVGKILNTRLFHVISFHESFLRFFN